MRPLWFHDDDDDDDDEGIRRYASFDQALTLLGVYDQAGKINRNKDYVLRPSASTATV